MIERKIKALIDFRLRTYFGCHYLSKGEVKTIRFKNHQTFESQVKLGNLVEAEKDEPEAKNLPIILPEADEIPIEDAYPTDLPASKSANVDEIPIEEQLVNLPKLETPDEPVEEDISKSDEVVHD